MIALFKGNTVFADQRDKIPVGVLRQRRFHKVWVLAQVVRRRDIVIGEITASTTGNQNFSPRFFSMIEQQYLTAASRRLCCAHQSRRTCANNYHIDCFAHHCHLIA
ncbi:Uncharacterised protein [Vibrio cholerae]|nr:Uncharacterised protein [Vibrio cholerae]CSD88349.1 Uncharacterised protein [Vibrio cholerae]